MCQVRQQSDTVRRVIRPAWSATDEQRKQLSNAVKAAKAADQMEDEAWEEIRRARDLGIPDTVICEETGRSRATLNRKFGARREPPKGN